MFFFTGCNKSGGEATSGVSTVGKQGIRLETSVTVKNKNKQFISSGVSNSTAFSPDAKVLISSITVKDENEQPTHHEFNFYPIQPISSNQTINSTEANKGDPRFQFDNQINLNQKKTVRLDFNELPKPLVQSADGLTSVEALPLGKSHKPVLVMDTRYNGEAAYRANSKADCLSQEKRVSSVGQFLCYKFIIFQPFNYDVSGLEGEESANRLLHGRVTIALKAYKQDKPTELLSQFEIVGKKWDQKLRLVTAVNPAGIVKQISGYEPTATAGGHLFFWFASGASKVAFPSAKSGGGDIYYTFSETPWKAEGWTFARRFRNLHNIKDTMICRKRNLNHTCSAEEKERFADVFSIAEKPLRYPDGKTISSRFGCNYPWISPDGSDLFCSLRSGHAVIGRHTHYTLKAVDNSTNYSRKIPEHILDALPENRRNKVKMGRVLLFNSFGMSGGFWPAFESSFEHKMPLNRRSPAYFLNVQNTLVHYYSDVINTVYRQNKGKLGGRTEGGGRYIYSEAPLDDAMDPRFEIFLHMKNSIRLLDK